MKQATRSNQIDKFMGSFMELQKNLSNTKNEKKNPFFKSMYTDLPTTLGYLRDLLPDYGFVFSQPMEILDGDPYLATILYHESGQWLKSYTPLPCKDKNDPHKLASAMTQMRRYALQSMVGFCGTNDDDDGNKATKEAKKDDNIIKEFGEKWSKKYGREAVISFIEEQAKARSMEMRPAIKMYSEQPEGFVKEIEAWLDKKEIESDVDIATVLQ